MYDSQLGSTLRIGSMQQPNKSLLNYSWFQFGFYLKKFSCLWIKESYNFQYNAQKLNIHSVAAFEASSHILYMIRVWSFIIV